MTWYHSLVTKSNVAILAVLILGLALRLWGIGFGLPYMYHPDEGVPVAIALQILHTGDFNPHFYNWPSLIIYLNALVYFIYFLLGRLVGVFANPSDLPYPDVEIMAVGKATLPAEFLLGRGLSAIVGTGSIILVYLILQQFNRGKVISLVAALLMAVDPLNVRNSHFIRPDTLAVFFSLSSFFFAVRILDDPRLRNYVFAAIGAGLAASSKYNAIFIVTAIVAAHFIRFQWRSLQRKEIYIAALVSLLAFLVATPYAILDAPRFLQIGPLDDARIYSTGHPGAEGDTLNWYINFLWVTQGWTLLFGLAELVAVAFTRERKELVLLSFPVIYFLFINLYTVHSEATILPIISFLLIFAALFAARILDYTRRKWPSSRARVPAIAIVLALVLILPPLRASAANDSQISEKDGREQARQWIETNLRPGSRIALEAYSPYLDREKFVIAGFYGLPDHLPDWYVSQGFEYLVFSQGIYARYFADPVRYSTEIERYNAFFSRFTPIAQFDQNDIEIRIYKTGVVLPTHRVAARFGNDGEVIELVGYNSLQSALPGSLALNLYWRPLAQAPEPLELEMRLLAQDDREVTRTRADLFQGKGWQNQMFETVWTMPLPNEMGQSPYRLQVNVIQSRFQYHLPVMNYADQHIDPVILGPF